MANYTVMKKNMILGQFLPGLIKDEKIINFYNEISRENFLPDSFKALAYSDLNIRINIKRCLPSPFNSAKIFQEANLQSKEIILLIGANYGYEAAILSKIVDTVIALEEDKEMKNIAEENIKKNALENIVIINSMHEKGNKKLGPYDTIVSLDPGIEIKTVLLDQLVDGGKLFFFEKQNYKIQESKLSVFFKVNKKYIKQKLFDLNMPSFINNTTNDRFDFS